MKIQKLTIDNIASIVHAEIDFDKSPLIDDPIFLITGDTGTGKTTILNAICLALYDKVPALETISSAEPDGDGLQTNNPRQLMRKGSAFASVTLTFIGNDDKHYEASWQTHRARKKANGTIQNTVRTLKEVGRDLPYKGQEMKQVVQRVVGLTFDQYTRTTMLAQGQFATFMKASDDAKSDILEKLTGTEIYARIGKKINELFKAKELEHNALDAEIKAMDLLSDEKKQEYASAIAALGESITQLNALFQSIDKQLSWLTHESDLRSQLLDKQTAKTAAEQQAASEENQRKKQAVKEWDETVEIRRLIKQKTQHNAELATLHDSLSHLAGEKWHAVLDGIKWIERKKETADSQATRLQASVSSQQPFCPVYANAQSIDTLAKGIAKSLADQKKHANESQHLNADAEKSLSDEKPIAEKAINAAAQTKAKAEEVEQKKRELDACELDKASGELLNYTRARNANADAISAVKEYRKLLDSKALADGTLAESRQALSATEQLLRQAEADKPALKEAHTRCDAYLQGQQELNDHINSLRERFSEIHECPLCGNKQAQMPSDEAINEKLKEAKRAADEAKEALEEAERRINSLKAQAKEQIKSIASQEKAATKAQKELEVAEEKAKLLTPDYAAPDCIENLEAEKNRIEALIDQIQKKVEAANAALNLYNRAHSKLLQLQSDQTKAEKALAEQQQNTAKLRQKAETELDIAEKCLNDAKENLAEMRKLAQCHDSEAFGEILADATGSEEITLNTARQAADLILTKASDYGTEEKHLDTAKRQSAELSRRLHECREATEPLAEHFGTDYIPVAIEAPKLEEDIRTLSAKWSSLDGQIKAETEKAAATQQQIGVWYASSTISPETVDKIGNSTEAEVNRFRSESKAIDDALQKAKLEIGVISEQLQKHEEAKPEIEEGATAESLADDKTRVSDEKDKATAEKSGLETLLENDTANAEKQAAKLVRLKGLYDELTNWAHLNKCFGNADGSLFKRVAQSYVLRLLLSKANYYLQQLAPRYALDCPDGSLTIYVTDSDQGDYVRNVGLLSGGESFVVSLALALGLSAISKDKIDVDTLFIDEGFGTLDKNILDKVVTVLDRLHNLGGRRIGIISHVQDLKDRIPTQIRLVRTGPSTSSVEVTTL